MNKVYVIIMERTAIAIDKENPNGIVISHTFDLLTSTFYRSRKSANIFLEMIAKISEPYLCQNVEEGIQRDDDGNVIGLKTVEDFGEIRVVVTYMYCIRRLNKAVK